MLNTILTKIIGTKNERELKAIRPVIAAHRRARAARPPAHGRAAPGQDGRVPRSGLGETAGAPLDDLLPEAFAVVREAGRRVLNMRHFDVQLIGGITLHRGTIAEMKTGEGKTLVATLPPT